MSNPKLVEGALRELTEAARGFIDGKPKTLRRLRNATTEAERALAEARAAIEGEPQPVGHTKYRLVEAGKLTGHWECECGADLGDAPIDEINEIALEHARQAERVLEAPPRVEPLGPCICGPGHVGHMEACPAGYIKPAAAPLPTAREDALAKEIIRVNKYPEKYPITKAEGWHVLVDMAEKELVAPQPLSEGRLREALEAVIAADDIGLNTQMDPKFAAQFQKAARLCAAALESA